ncbi:MAG: AarF/ABC1/UbiB kinase family protein [Anaerolineae bacterium]|nr:AarF/ABC1/UbiB kinase family protein [Anaerolineae bacterium]
MPDSNNPNSTSTSQAASKPPDDPAPRDGARFSADDLSAELAGYRVHWRRYRRTLRFAAWLIMRAALWELLLRYTLGSRFTGRGRSARLRRWAREFRDMAADMGGVMIKLGQFVSSRVDVLPPEMIAELATLQDEVPTVPFDHIRRTLVQELGPPDRFFSEFNTEPTAAASLGQVHRARLPDGSRVVVKVQRPGIESLVYTDLKALGVVARWAMRWRFIARRANVPALLDEFSAVLWEELNYTLEAKHVETFRAMFADDMGVYIPRLHRELSTRRVLTLEDVSAIKIMDVDALAEAGIDRRDVARRLISTYLRMLFVERFFHADPHPGNLFVYPLPPDAPANSGLHHDGQPVLGARFYLIFVDFGMTGRLTPEIVAGLSETLIALVTRDPRRLLRSYERLGVLLPGADRDRIEQAAQSVFDQIWGLTLSEISGMQVSEMTTLGREFSDLLLSMPFQVPQDFLVLARAVGILVGICTGLDPEFDPWREIKPFVNDLLVESGDLPALAAAILGQGDTLGLDVRGLLRPAVLRAAFSDHSMNLLLTTALDLARRMVEFPVMANNLLRHMERGELTVRVEPTAETTHLIRRLEDVVQRLVNAVVFAAVALCGVLLYVSDQHTAGLIGGGLAAVLLLRVLLSGSSR